MSEGSPGASAAESKGGPQRFLSIRIGGLEALRQLLAPSSSPAPATLLCLLAPSAPPSAVCKRSSSPVRLAMRLQHGDSNFLPD